MARKPAKRAPLVARLRANFFTGLAIVVPMALTVWLVWTAITFFDNRILPLVPGFLAPVRALGDALFGVGVVIFLIFTTFIGYVAKGYLGRELIRAGERMVDRMPLVRSLYNGLKQIVETVLSQTNASFQQACLVEYPRKGIWAVAFISTEAKGELPDRVGRDDLVSVFLPTTPNPTSGFLLYLPRSECILLEMSVEEAAKLVISAGLVAPPTKEEIAAGRRAARPAQPRAAE